MRDERTPKDVCGEATAAVSINSAAATIIIAKLANLARFVANILIQNIILFEFCCVFYRYILFPFELYII